MKPCFYLFEAKTFQIDYYAAVVQLDLSANSLKMPDSPAASRQQQLQIASRGLLPSQHSEPAK